MVIVFITYHHSIKVQSATFVSNIFPLNMRERAPQDYIDDHVWDNQALLQLLLYYY